MRLELRRPIRKNSPLEAYARNINSQGGEDGIIAHILRVIEPAQRYCVEFGAWDGRQWSNCCALLHSKPIVGAPWGGLMIESNEQRFEELRANYAERPDVATFKRFVDFDGPDRLDNILAEANAPKSFGLLSIDIDGNDYHVWDSLTDYKPELVAIEFNPTVPNDVFFVQDRSFDVNQGCSVLALIELGKSKGYELAVTTQANAFFVIAEKFPLLGIADNSISTIHEPAQDGRIFQGYDTSIHVVGMDCLV